MNHDIFISYSSKQKSIADGVCHYLEENGFKCWMAPRDISGGHNYGDCIYDAIVDCKVFVLVFSEAASLSPWVNGEIHRAFSDNKPIIPFRIDEMQVTGDWDIMLNSVHWIDAFPNYADKLPDLLDCVRSLIGNRPLVKIVKPRQPRLEKRRRRMLCFFGCFIAAIIALVLLLTRAHNNTDIKGNGTFVGHEYVDLGLPSGTLWATCNVGAFSPERYGDYFAWGETQSKSIYNWDTYKYCQGTNRMLTKYCCDSKDGFNGFFDNLFELQSNDDAATINWGDGWSTPTIAQWKELLQYTTSKGATINGIKGKMFRASNGKAVFLPFAGHFSWSNLSGGAKGDELSGSGASGSYWTNSLPRGFEVDFDFNMTPVYVGSVYPAWYFHPYSDDYNFLNGSRCEGFSIRPVTSFPKVNAK